MSIQTYAKNRKSHIKKKCIIKKLITTTVSKKTPLTFMPDYVKTQPDKFFSL